MKTTANRWCGHCQKVTPHFQVKLYPFSSVWVEAHCTTCGAQDPSERAGETGKPWHLRIADNEVRQR